MLGIGGIGMSALARWFRLHGKSISGYDKTQTPLTDALIAEGIPVEFDFNPQSIEGVDLMVITPAVPKENPVMEAALQKGIRIIKRAELLGLLSNNFRTIAIAGTHGKTTTTGMTTWLLKKGGVDCTGFIGGILKNFDSNFVPGKSDWIVAEADEFDRSFLQLNPEVSVITSVDPDHLDIYGTAEDVKSGYAAFAEKLKPGGLLLLNDRLRSFSQTISKNAYFYGLANADRKAEHIRSADMGTFFDYVTDKEQVKDLFLSIPGRYNLENALAAISAARYAGASWEGIREGLATFKGIARRFDIQYISERIALIDDYAHHPEEIRSLLPAVRSQFPDRKMVVIFQPHLFTRTRDFADGFAEALSGADEVLLLDIYPARELPIPGVSSKMLMDKITAPQKGLTSKTDLPGEIRERLNSKTVFLTVGAGDIDACVPELKKTLEDLKA